MTQKRLHPKAWVALALNGLYYAAEGLCAIFVSVYFWINSLDFQVVCRHYLALYLVTPGVFMLAAWYSQARDRLHVYRLGLALHAVYYATLLALRERSPEYATALGVLLGVTWGVFWPGANTFNFDVTDLGKREYYFGVLRSVTGFCRLVAPMAGSLVIRLSPDRLQGYHRIFAAAMLLYVACLALSFRMPPDNVRRPFRIRRALLPGKDQRDWRLIMLASASMAGSFSILVFLLSLLMYMQTGDELSVGGYASFRGLVAIVAAYGFGRVIAPGKRRKFMRAGMVLVVLAGALIAFKLTVATLVLFGLLRTVGGFMFGIPHSGLRLDTIAQTAQDPAQRIEYLAAWEVPLAVGRVVMMLVLMALYGYLSENELGLRLAIFLLCAARIGTYLILTQTTALRAER